MIKIAVDSGTTNCRVKFIEDNKVIWTERSGVGIKDVAAANGNNSILEVTLQKLIIQGLQNMQRTLEDVSYVVGSGMITSNLGLLEIPHLTAPADFKVFADNLKVLNFEWLKGIPFYLIPGLKNNTEKDIALLSDIDVMRGEEVETFGVLESMSIQEKTLVILPGSHTKFVYVDEKGEIVRCVTTMLGEILSALAESTILKSALPEGLIESIDHEFVKLGVSYQGSYGLSNASFATRLLQIQLETTANQRANFIGGALVSDDLNRKIISDILQGEWKRVIVGGTAPLRDLFVIALKEKGVSQASLTVVDEEVAKNAPAFGAIKIVDTHFESKKLQ
jgi:2-dehydro-3-deoxygalactonokinase